MENREKILQRIANVKVAETPLPSLKGLSTALGDTTQNFIEMVRAVGGKVVEVDKLDDVLKIVDGLFPSSKIICTDANLPLYSPYVAADPHTFEDVDLAILPGHFGVAENGAVWITDPLMGDRAIPFIVQHLALVVQKRSIVPTLHDAYERIGLSEYDFGVFIAGPSKTADIEQSLVFGAHGPKSLTVFLLD
jgi:L-lactate dehydrogenase complex protein LldG